MGLSASQARLLSLTARQSNLEYEGQQINQQRTSLSNESSNYYNSLLEMSVPVPPSTNDYTKVVYSFTIGGNEATLIDALPQNDEIGNATYLISYTTTLSTIGIAENESYKTAASATKLPGSVTILSKDAPYEEANTYYLATMNYMQDDEYKDIISGSEANNFVPYVQINQCGDPNSCIIIGPTGYQISYADYTANIAGNKDLNDKCKFFRPYDKDVDAQNTSITKYGISYTEIPNESTFNAHRAGVSVPVTNNTGADDDNNQAAGSKNVPDMIYKYDSDEESTGERPVYSYKASNSKNFTVVDPEYEESFINAGLNINDYYQYEATKGVRFVKRQDVEGNLNTQTRAVKTSAVATIKVKKENSMKNARIEFDAQGRISTVTDEEGHTYTMTATTETDNAAYDDAYNQYEYNQYIYDQRQNEINANIKILQAQDKSLELRLSTLDTQHSAIQTELEAVKKVMSKNIENSFKTFNA